MSEVELNEILVRARIFRTSVALLTPKLVRAVILFMCKCEEEIGGPFTDFEKKLAQRMLDEAKKGLCG